jgi:hypothetical protein
MTAESVRYLGASIAARRTAKLKTVKLKLKEMEVLPAKILSSSPLTVQKIDIVKTFVLSSIDFLLLNGEVARSQSAVMDKKTGGIINKDLKIKGLPIECHHALWTDGRYDRLIL